MVASCRKLALCFAAQPPENRTHNNEWQQQMHCEVQHLVKQNEDNDKLAALTSTRRIFQKKTVTALACYPSNHHAPDKRGTKPPRVYTTDLTH